jgi:hypothetical protein
MAFVAVFWLPPAIITFLACALGHVTSRTGGTWFRPALVALVAATSLVALVLPLWAHDPDVPDRDLVAGVAFAVLGLAALPVLAFYTLGFFIPYAWMAAMLWFVGSIALGWYSFLGWVLVAAYVVCEPGAYECPL